MVLSNQDVFDSLPGQVWSERSKSLLTYTSGLSSWSLTSPLLPSPRVPPRGTPVCGKGFHKFVTDTTVVGVLHYKVNF